jgi:hypothetical protein
MFSLFDLNVPIASGNAFSEVNVATAEQGNTALGSAFVAQGNTSGIVQTTGDVFDIL